MLCSITRGWFSGKSSYCDIHLLYVVLFWSDHWHRYVLNFFVFLYLSLISFDLWFNIMWMESLSGLFFVLGGGLGCWDCCGSNGCKGFTCILNVSSLFPDIYLAFNVQACGCVLHRFGQFWLQFCWQKSCSAIRSAVFLSFVGIL